MISVKFCYRKTVFHIARIILRFANFLSFHFLVNQVHVSFQILILANSQVAQNDQRKILYRKNAFLNTRSVFLGFLGILGNFFRRFFLRMMRELSYNILNQIFQKPKELKARGLLQSINCSILNKISFCSSGNILDRPIDLGFAL